METQNVALDEQGRYSVLLGGMHPGGMPLDLFAKGEPRSKAAMERAMKVQEVILRAISKQIRWFEGARILGLSGRQLGRLYYRYRTPFFSLASFDFLCKDR